MGCVTRIQVLRGTTLERLSFTPLVGELVYDTTLNLMFVGDGITLGGLPFSGEDPAVIEIFTSNQNLSGIDYAIANSGSGIDFTLPDATTYQKPIRVKNAGTAVLDIFPSGGQLIDGETDIQLKKNNAIVLVPKSGGWYIW